MAMFTEIHPTEALKPYVKRFYFYEASSDLAFHDVVFPSGNMEIIFNLGNGCWKTKKEDTFQTTPAIELWGQLTKPLVIQSVGKNCMLGVRFYPHSAAYFFRENVSLFNNDVMDGAEVFGPAIKTLHALLLDLTSLEDRILQLETYLLSQLILPKKKYSKIKFVEEIAKGLRSNASEERIGSFSERHKISSRYLHQLFSQYTGLTPKLFCKINRFQHSLNLMQNQGQKLTSVGYDSGYFDQSHFIREFKLFTGTTPTSFSTQATPINQILSNV
ncbi:MAG TPA: helix-turn-helix domain-containing protein [Chryseolinea sp.]